MKRSLRGLLGLFLIVGFLVVACREPAPSEGNQRVDTLDVSEVLIKGIPACNSEESIFGAIGTPDSLVVSPPPPNEPSKSISDIPSTEEYVYHSKKISFYSIKDSLCLSGVRFRASQETLRYHGLALHENTKLEEVKEAFPNSYASRSTYEGEPEGTTKLLLSSGYGKDPVYLRFREGRLTGFDYLRWVRRDTTGNSQMFE